MSTTHTPDFGEPWEFATWNSGVNRSPGWGLLSESADIQITVHTTKPKGLFSEEDCTEQARQRAVRVVTCVNAFAGITDPAAAIQAVRDALQAAENLNLDFLRNYEFGDEADTKMLRLRDTLQQALALLTPKP